MKSTFKLKCINKWREDWFAVVSIAADRATGSLHYKDDIIRDHFDVAVKNGKFSVDIGTGSGVKVSFKVP